MKRSRFSEEQIAYALRLAESGTPVVDVCRQIGVSEATYYTWKKKFGDLGVTEIKRPKMLGDENARLKRIVADLTLAARVKVVVGVPRRKATVCRCTCCIRDEGRPLGFADQAVIPNHPELLPLRAVVVSV